MTELAKTNPDPAFIEIDVIGYKVDFNRASLAGDVSDNDVKMTVRRLNASQISTTDTCNPLQNSDDYRAAKTKITMHNGEIIYSPRSEDEIIELISKALQSPKRFASCYAQKPEQFGKWSKASDLQIFADFESAGVGLGGPGQLYVIDAEKMQREFVGGDRQP